MAKPYTEKVTEDEFSEEVIAFFKAKLSKSMFAQKVDVVSGLNILRDITVGRDPKTSEWKIYFGFQEQDVIFVPKQDSPYLEFLKGPAEYHWLKSSQNSFTVPLVICELKVPQSMNTHQFITYSKIAEQIKETHPFCAYYFILRSNKERGLMPETVSRQAKTFDRVFLEWNEGKHEIWEAIDHHLKYLSMDGQILNPEFQ
jgi:hypothetical protein